MNTHLISQYKLLILLTVLTFILFNAQNIFGQNCNNCPDFVPIVNADFEEHDYPCVESVGGGDPGYWAFGAECIEG